MRDDDLMDDGANSRSAFREAAIAWAAGGRGQPLVDAAAEALAAGLDSPTLRVLAGTPHSSADAEASELAEATFNELGLDIESRLSSAALIEGARQLARRFIAGEMEARELARLLYGLYVGADYPAELNTWSGFDDHYDLVRDGVISGSAEEIDVQVAAAARDLAEGRQSTPVSIGSLFVQSSPPTRPNRRGSGWFRRRTP